MADAAADQTPSEDARLQTGDEASERRHIFIILLLAAVLLPVALGTSTVIFNDGDVSWHIATGRWIIEHGRIPAGAPLSFTAARQPWVPVEWLAELVLAISYDLAGYGGLSALVMLALVLLNLVVFVHGARFLRPVAIVAIIGAMDVILKPMMFARPHLLAWPLLALWTMLMLHARDRERAPPLAAALLMLVWVNFHGSFVMGLAIAGAFGLEALIQSSDRSRVARQWGLFGLACLAAALLNPNGLEGLIHPFFIANLELLPLIDE